MPTRVVMAAGLAVSMLAMPLAGFAQGEDERSVVFGGSAYYPPFEWLDENGRPQGFLIDLEEVIAERGGRRPVHRLTEWAEGIRALDRDQVDVMPMFPSEARAEKYLFTDPFYYVLHAIYGPSAARGISGPESLAGKRVAVVARGYAESMLEGMAEGVLLQPRASIRDALRAVSEGEAEFALVAKPTAARFVEMDDLSLQAQGPPFWPKPYVFAVSRDRPQLLAWMRSNLRGVVAEGEYYDVYASWEDELGWSRPDLLDHVRQLSVFLVPLVMLVLLGWLYSWQLRRRVAAKTNELRIKEKERRALEERFLQSQKMEAVGRLAAGVAHDFNNLLTIIDGNAEFLLDELPPGDPRHEEARQIEQASRRAGTLTRQLLAFSRQEVREPRVLDLNAVVGDLEKMLPRLIGEDIELTVTLDSDLLAVFADPGQVEQVVMNLVVNARDAMPTGGRIDIEVQNTELDAEYTAKVGDLRPGPYVALTVADAGTGIDPEILDQIFEPFVTTKGHGTGLGLATVYGIVKQSGGHVEVSSDPGAGTAFTVYLPARSEHVDPDPREEIAVPVGPASETILLVEDEPAVRAVARRMLEGAGYTVVEAPDGEDAIRLIEAEGVRPDILVTDVVLPGMSGRELADVVRERLPGLPVLFASGYTDEEVASRGALEAGTSLLEKPFTAQGLLQAVRRVLA